MPLLDFLNFTWLRNLLGIRKDLIDTKKSKLEVRKLEDEELSRILSTEVTLDEILKYDTERLKLVKKALKEELEDYDLKPSHILKPAPITLKRIDQMLVEIYKELKRRDEHNR
jgi:hypothetical protein